MKSIRPILYLASIFWVSSPAEAQSNPASFLSRYSYPIFTLPGNQQYTGTAFFYQSDLRTYLVSNYHAIKGMSPVKQVINFSADTLYVKYKSIESGEYKVMPIDISEEVTGKTEVFSMVNRIDLFKIAVDLPADADIFFINDLIEEEYLDLEPEEIIAFGFPTEPGAVPTFYSKQKRLEGKVNPNGYLEYDTSLRLNFPDASDSARAIVKSTSRYYYFIKPYAAGGYSGAPVFGKFRDKNNNIIYRFSGVIFAGQPSTRQTWAIKGAVALQYLQGEL